MLGLIEGFYGRPWTMNRRRSTISALRSHDYEFYAYAPKFDPYLRRKWRTPYPDKDLDALIELARYCQNLGVRFGLGFSPYELHRDFNQDSRTQLRAKLEQLRELKFDLFAILFDDMRGDTPELASTQLAIVEVIAEQLPNVKLIFCPTYYSDDPTLDRAFGHRPSNYLDTIGRTLDPAISIFWTGPEICSREFTRGHIEKVVNILRRKPFLWDNYPVNDGPRMSRYLHLRAVTGRSTLTESQLEGHAVNPALQPTLTQIPAMTLSMAYRQGPHYDYGRAFREASEAVCGPQLAQCLWEDLGLLQETGLDRLSNVDLERLRVRYGGFDHEAAREVLAFLNGEYRFDDETN